MPSDGPTAAKKRPPPVRPSAGAAACPPAVLPSHSMPAAGAGAATAAKKRARSHGRFGATSQPSKYAKISADGQRSAPGPAPASISPDGDKVWLLEERVKIAKRKLAEFSLERFRAVRQVGSDPSLPPTSLHWPHSVESATGIIGLTPLKALPVSLGLNFRYVVSSKWWRDYVAFKQACEKADKADSGSFGGLTEALLEIREPGPVSNYDLFSGSVVTTGLQKGREYMVKNCRQWNLVRFLFGCDTAVVREGKDIYSRPKFEELDLFFLLKDNAAEQFSPARLEEMKKKVG